jgi:hypothetical protein
MFDLPIEPDNSPIENINITTLQLFFSAEEHRQFKELCKTGMVKMYPQTYHEKNISDFLLHLVELYNINDFKQ